ncbi:hypothetical protein CANARDRAFT_205943 [[Candida] arabinofermentans NRRL YB-2248]|uniref:DnaJ homologue subfamily C member 28 conserved domain-containing protein n=1 Tax=[Candida] arabinofermentans NRRL YB-2248 TaxID=983967 RepID=A0A1E4T6H5_9ASCO|nr:hypothetical protein CANARDRAFT_205943 [[Candida] arabinofermentans NRRL YB-2248]
MCKCMMYVRLPVQTQLGSIRSFHKSSSIAKQASKDSKEQEENTFKQKLAQMAEDATPTIDDPKAGFIADALPYNKEAFHSKLQKIEDDNFEHQYQKEIGISKLPSYTSKHSRELAMAPAWTGKESVYDASVRMLNDKYTPRKSTTYKSRPLITPKPSLKERLNNARESALDYSISKIEEKPAKKKDEFEEEDDFAERYRERLLGPAQLLNDSFAAVDNSIKSLADQRIRDAQKRGEFDGITRGKPLPANFTSTDGYIERTEYHLNNILKRQDAIPPWIEKQGSVSVMISQFRNQLDDEWRQKAVNLINELYSKETLEQKLDILSNFIKAEATNQGHKLRSVEWENHQLPYLKAKINSLNDNIRGYNLQAPLPSQKLYLILEKEREASYKRVAPSLPDALKRHVLKPEEKKVGLGNYINGNLYTKYQLNHWDQCYSIL